MNWRPARNNMASRSDSLVHAALILAAGRGERMRPLTDAVPKPLLSAGGRRLIEWQIDSLARAGIRQLVINTAHLPGQFETALGDGAKWDVHIRYSREAENAEGALETLGGVARALPLLGTDPFAVVSGDIVTDYDFRKLAAPAAAIARGDIDGHLVLVDNPPFHPRGDMGLLEGKVVPSREPHYTYANIGLFAPRLFAAVEPQRAKLFPWLYGAAEAGRISGELHRGRWYNVGTPSDLAALDRVLDAGALSA
jgi:N-acetyl-alpha-D-muramate 1-phosphate uridylyltransferase